jgi:phosphoglycerate dehydrogenase-like enzyme
MKIGVTSSAFSKNPVLRKELTDRYADVTFYEGTTQPTEEQLIALLADRDAAVVGMEMITERILAASPNLKAIGKSGIGCEMIDFEAMRRHGVAFGFTAGANRRQVAELTLCFMIAALRLVTPLNQEMRAGARPRLRFGRGLADVVIGLHGCGNIGKDLVGLLKPFGCEIIACDLVDYADFYREQGVTAVSFDELLARSDVLSLHLPKTAETVGLYDARTLARMKEDAVLVNTCRGGIVDERAVYERLRTGALFAACFDVFEVEPTPYDDLLQLPNFLATPHIGANTAAVRLAMGRNAIEGLTKNEQVRPGQTF